MRDFTPCTQARARKCDFETTLMWPAQHPHQGSTMLSCRPVAVEVADLRAAG